MQHDIEYNLTGESKTKRRMKNESRNRIKNNAK